jgi:hypothetical protein
MERSPYDRQNGPADERWPQGQWDSDTFEGQQRMAKRQMAGEVDAITALGQRIDALAAGRKADAKVILKACGTVIGEHKREVDKRLPLLDQEGLLLGVADALREHEAEIDQKVAGLVKKDAFDLVWNKLTEMEQRVEQIEARLVALEPDPPGDSIEHPQPVTTPPSGATASSSAVEISFAGRVMGLYKAGETYRKHDRVALNSAEWIAKKDDPGPLPGAGWMLGAKGRVGKQGARGPTGVGIAKIATEGTQLAITLSDGSRTRVDLRDAIRQIMAEARSG